MAKGKNKKQSTAPVKAAGKTYIFHEKMRAALDARYGSRWPREYETLMELLADPQNLVRKDKKGPVSSKNDKNFRVEAVWEEMLGDLTVEERKMLIPKTVKESRDMLNYASETKTARNEDTLWRRVTGYGNWNFELTSLIAEKLKGKKCLEIMAGNGLFSYMLQESGLRVIATDISPDKNNDYISMRDGNYCDVLGMDALAAIRKHGQNADILICSWPPHQEEQVIKAFEAFSKLNPKGMMLYVGEWKGGFNATDAFFDSVEIVDELEDINKAHLCHSGSKDVIRLLKLKEA